MGVLMTTFFGVVVLSLVLVLGNIFKELLDLLINRDVPIESVLAFMLFVLPFSLTFTIPWGFLTALLLVFGRLSADNELIALRSNGVSIQRICAPIFILAVVLTSICMIINIEIAPRAEQAMTQAIFRIATNNPMSLFEADEIIDEFPDRRIYVGGKSGDKLQNVILFEFDHDHDLIQMVHAKEGELTSDPDNRRLLLRLFDAHFEQRDEDDPRNLDKMRRGIVLREGVFPISLEQLYDEHSRGRRISSYTLGELQERYAEEVEPERKLEVRVEMNRRFSASMACIAFALIAVPLGITAHRRETSVGFAFSLAIAFTYFFFIIMAETFKREAAAQPVFLMWAPNLLFIGLGAVLFYRLIRR